MNTDIEIYVPGIEPVGTFLFIGEVYLLDDHDDQPQIEISPTPFLKKNKEILHGLSEEVKKVRLVAAGVARVIETDSEQECMLIRRAESGSTEEESWLRESGYENLISKLKVVR